MRSAKAGASGRELALQALIGGGTQASLHAVLGGQAEGTEDQGPDGTAHRGADDQAHRGPEATLHEASAAREQMLATQLTYGAVKMRRALRWSLGHHLRRPFQSLDPTLQNILLLGAYQILYLRKIPAYSAVDESVRLARRYGHSGTAALANAVLRRLASQPMLPPPPEKGCQVEELANFASVPDWIAQHWIERFSFPTALKIAAGVNQPPRRALRVNTTRVSAAALRDQLASKNILTHESRYGIAGCLVLEQRVPGVGRVFAQQVRLGMCTVQSEESQFAVHALSPTPGETVVDVCAGRGVKSGAIAERIHPAERKRCAVDDKRYAVDDKLYAVDDSAPKLELLRLEFQRLGMKRPQVIRHDARRPYSSALPSNADAVLVDAPCSGIGTLGRRPELRWQKNAGDPQRYGPIQLAILNQAASIVRPGGRLLYAVCSTATHEAEVVVDAFLAGASDWRSQSLALGKPHTGMLSVGNYALSVPGIDGADGFFYALLVRHS